MQQGLRISRLELVGLDLMLRPLVACGVGELVAVGGGEVIKDSRASRACNQSVTIPHILYSIVMRLP